MTRFRKCESIASKTSVQKNEGHREIRRLFQLSNEDFQILRSVVSFQFRRFPNRFALTPPQSVMKNQQNLLTGLVAHWKTLSFAKGTQSFQKNRRRNKLRSMIVEQLEGRSLLAAIDLAALGVQGLTLYGAAIDDSSGIAVSSAGDVNGDGYDDVIIGAKLADRTATDPAPQPVSLSGKSYVVFGGPSLPSTIDLATLGSNGFRILGANASDYSGFSVTAVGDINGDGKDDLAVSSPFADATYVENIGTVLIPNLVTRTRANAGETHIVFGRSSPTLANDTIDLNALGTNGFRILGAEAFDQTGFTIAGAGDFNGDGIDDLAIGAPDAAGLGNLKSSAGDSYIVFGTTTPHSTTFGITTLVNTLDLLTLGTKGIKIHGADIDDRSGYSLSLAGDLNGDGFDDLVIGAAGGDAAGNAKQLAGEAYVLFGGKSVASVVSLSTLGTPSGASGTKVYGAAAYDGLGYSLSVVGDVNGDGLDDVLIGARFAAVSSNSYAGKSYLLYGSGALGSSIDLASPFSGVTFLGADAGDESGASVRGAGDVNGDGYNDLIIGAPNGDSIGVGRSNAGESYLLFGGNSLPSTMDLSTVAASSSPAIGVTIWGATSDDKSGTSIDSAGDVNGDGFDDLIIGAPSADAAGPGRAGAGESYIVYGGNGFTSSVTNLGSSASESLSGTPGIDVIVGGGGDDGLAGNGGADVLIGGQGNDFLVVSSMNFRRLVGGTGNDTLTLDGGGHTLNLTTLANNRIQGIEEIDLTGTGDNTLILSQRDVLNASDESNTLIVRGNAGDLVSTLGWTAAGTEEIPASSSNFYNVYTQGNAILKVRGTITFKAGLDLGALTASEGSTIVGTAADDLSGFSVSNAGDVNGDGYEDIILGAHQADPSSLSNAGASYIIFGSATPSATISLASANITILGAAAGNLTGQSVSAAGDVNGDGFADFIVGAPATSTSAGKSYVFFGSGSPAATINLASVSASITISGAAASESSGISVSSAGDVDGDGYDDLLVGADNATTANGSSSGRTTLIWGSASPASTIDLGAIGSNGFSILGGSANDNSGRSVSAAGDLNKDGYDDIVIGSENADDGANTDAGKTYVIFGSAARPSGPINLATLALPTGIIFTGEAGADLSGTSVSNAGDIDGDGYEDLIIGARGSDPSGRTDAGKSYVVFGGPSLASINLSALGTGGFSIVGVTAGNATGVSVSAAGDVNGDGYDDLIIGADLANPGGRTDAGETYLLFGSSTRPIAPIDLTVVSNGLAIVGGAIDDRAGHSVSQAGDVNGDGYDDLLIGAFQADDGATSNVGKAYILYGRDFTDSVTHTGSSSADAITGTSGANTIVAGGGNDSVAGNGGLDVIIGGQGNDIITITSTIFQRIDGGTGSDTLVFDGVGMFLDLTDLMEWPSSKLFDVETIDITGSGNNTLTLDVKAVLNLSSSSNTLRVRKNIGDTVTRGSGWTQGANQVFGTETFEVFTQGAATLLVQFFAQPTLTVSATSRAYNGALFAPTFVLSGSTAPTPTVSFEFYLDSKGVLPISTPKNAGEYYVRAVSAANGSNAAAASHPLGDPVINLVAFSITQKALTAAGGVGIDKVYDGTTSGKVSRTLTGVVSGDDVIGTSTATFSAGTGGKNVGTNKTLTPISTVVLTGADAANYTVGTSNTTARTANVTKMTITGSAVAANKTYDGNTSTTVNINLNGFISGDLVSATGTGVFNTANAGDLKPVTVSGVVLAGADAGNYDLSPVSDTAATIVKKQFTATTTAANKVYNASTAATINYTNLSGFVGSETVTVATGTGTFNNKNVADNKAVTASAPVLSDGTNGGLAANYVLLTPTGLTANVTPASISTITGITASSRVYNGTTAATLVTTSAVFNGRFSGDVLTVATSTGNFVDKNVATGKTVNITGLTLGGTDAGNYTLASTTALATANITAKAIVTGDVVSRTGQNKQYDGTTVATVLIGFNSGVVIAGDDFVATATRAFSSAAVGTNKTISSLSNTTITRSGLDANNYTVANLTGTVTNADITKRVLTATATASNKVYDANTNASVSITLGNIVGVEVVSGSASGTFDNKNANTGKTVTIGTITLAGANSGNYTVGSASPTTANITQASLTASGTAANKVYDANTNASVTISLVGVLGSDVVSGTAGGTFSDKNVANGKTVTIGTVTLGGADAGNYNVGSAGTATADITQASLTASGIAANKVYDTNTNASVTISLVGVLGSDVVTGTAPGTFTDKNAANGKTVTIGTVTLGGADAGNYTVGSAGTTTANITQASLTASGTAANKVYDTNTNASVTISLVGVLGTDVVTGSASGSFADKNVANGKTVTIGTVTLGGADANNYTVGSAGTATANITAKAITGSITAANRAFNGTTAATILTRTLTGVIGADVVSYIGGTATFDTAAAGYGKTVTAIGLSLTGADAVNYSVNTTALTTANIYSTIAARHVFYNNATGANLSSAGAANNAIATNKSPLLPGQASTFSNYTNYSRGLNGIIVDINSLPATTTNAQILANLQFAQWNGIAVGGFTTLPVDAVPTATILSGLGTSGSARVKITITDEKLKNTWLRVTVLGNSTTALAANDVFYFGNVVGEVNIGNTATRLRVNNQDTSAVLANQLPNANTALVTNIYDFDRNGRVNNQDTSIVLANQQAQGIVAPITAPSSGSGFSAFSMVSESSSFAAPAPTLEVVSRPKDGVSETVQPTVSVQPNTIPVSSLPALSTLGTAETIISTTTSGTTTEKVSEKTASNFEILDQFYASLGAKI